MSFHFALVKKARECIKVGKYRFCCCSSGRKPIVQGAKRSEIKAMKLNFSRKFRNFCDRKFARRMLLIRYSANSAFSVVFSFITLKTRRSKQGNLIELETVNLHTAASFFKYTCPAYIVHMEFATITTAKHV